MATMIIECPSCGRKLRVPDELLGKAVKCPTCEHMFEAPTAQSPGRAASRISAGARFRLRAAGGSARIGCAAWLGRATSLGSGHRLSALPELRWRNDKDATRCRFCGEALKPEEQETNRTWQQTHAPALRRDAEPHRGTLILTLGIISIALGMLCGIFGLPLGIAAWVMGRHDLMKMRQRTMDPAGEGLTQAGWICGIIGTILDSLWLLGCLIYVAFIFTFALSMRPKPPLPPAPPVQPMPVPAPAGNKAAVLFVHQPWMRG